MANGQPAGPCAIVIFGASGDLTKRKLIPALYNLAAQKLLPKEFAVVGVSRSELTHAAFRDQLGREIGQFVKGSLDGDLLKDLLSRVYYLPGDAQNPETYRRLKAQLAEIDQRHGTAGNYLLYMATSQEFFAPIVEKSAAEGLTREENSSWRRVIVEKPFGRDLESAKALSGELRKSLAERQIYRIDHYLGKETVQNILVFRFANGIFEPIWNRRYVDHVQITVGEELGVEQRGGFYDQTGTLRDMVPNHIFQLISLTAMDPPVSFEADSVRDEQVKVLRALAPLSDEDVLSRTVRGQYGEGAFGGAKVPAYRAERLVAPDSKTETFVALKLLIDNWRWGNTPFYLRTGKRLPSRSTEIVVQFKQVPHVLFRGAGLERRPPNQLVIRIQPNEGIALSFEAKVPGPTLTLGSVDMNFNYQDYFGGRPSTGYERLLYDCMLGDATLFMREDMLEAAWGAVAPILDVWKALPPREFPNYPAGTWGPPEADELLRRDGRKWRECAG